MHGIFHRTLATGAGLAVATMLGAAARAQSQPATSPQASSAAAAPSSPQHRTIQMVQAQAELSKTLDAKKARQGDPVTAKLEQGVQIPDAQALPKNTVLEGHIDQVQPSAHKSDSMVTVTFDKAKLKGGQELPIKATVLAVAEPVMAQPQAEGGMPSGAPAAMPSSSPSGGAPGGGPAAGSSQPQQPPQQSMDTPSGNSGSKQPAQTKGVPGVTLKSDIHEQSSATFTSKGKNVHVPDGTQMAFALTIIPPGVRIQ
ncbi:MAG: hypothetical protein ACLGXA_09150 [Acidobacteriota bacterium]